MDVGWAVKAMKNGEKVRRHTWEALAEPCEGIFLVAWVHLYCAHTEGGIPEVMALRSDGTTSHFVMTDDYLLADDWELA